MTRGWTQQAERGSTFLIRFMAWLVRSGGRPFARALLYPISLYFVLFSLQARRASRSYLSRVLGRRAGLGEVFRHYHTFAATILDRVSFLSDDFERFDIRVHGLEPLTQYFGQGTGCILLGGHLGSFEVTRSLALLRHALPLKILMHQENAQRIGGVIAALNPDLADSIIDLASPNAMLETKEWLDSGGIVGILADRTTRDGKLVPVDFLGGRAWLPAGPFQLAALTQVPMVAICGLYRGNRRYDIHFTLLADKLPRRRRGVEGERQLQAVAQTFADTLERWTRDAPYNWFNFYDFWQEPGARD